MSAPASDPNPKPAQVKRPLQICIASPEFIGLSPHGGTGLAYTAMAQALAFAGHKVTCLYLGGHDAAARSGSDGWTNTPATV